MILKRLHSGIRLLARGCTGRVTACLLGLCLAFGPIVRAQDTERPLTTEGADSLSLLQARNAMLRSMVLPGWGQAYNDEWVKAAAFTLAELSLLYGARVQHTKWRDWKATRAEAFMGDDEALKEFSLLREEFYLDDRNKLLWWWMFVRLAGVLDAYVGGAMSNYDDDTESSTSRLRLGGPTGLPGVTVCIPVTFPGHHAPGGH